MPRLASTVVQKLWGTEQVIVNNELYCGKILTIQPGYQCSLHSHPKDETFLVIHGCVALETMEDWDLLEDEKWTLGTWLPTHLLRMGDIYHIPPNMPHRFMSDSETEVAVIAEFSTHHDDADVTRLEESRKI